MTVNEVLPIVLYILGAIFIGSFNSINYKINYYYG